MPKRLPAETYIEGILAGDRLMLSRAITLTESRLPSDAELAAAVLQGVLPRTGNSLRVGITGVPGVGKSTFIEAFGSNLVDRGHKLAVLAVDPTSQRSGGSIMGDKTRMEKLSLHPLAYVRPSPTGSSLGGVTASTRQAILLCEAAGFDLILVETVGVGQSETAVRGMTDFFLLLMLAGAGDELQGIKRGIMEMADAILITKADGDNEAATRRAQADYRNALHLFPPAPSGWTPEVLPCSAVTGRGLPETWDLLGRYQQLTTRNGFFFRNRQTQNLGWMHDTIRQALEDSFYANPAIKSLLPGVERAVQGGETSALAAARELLERWQNG
jgi:LAO/AO transport system kinase